MLGRAPVDQGPHRAKCLAEDRMSGRDSTRWWNPWLDKSSLFASCLSLLNSSLMDRKPDTLLDRDLIETGKDWALVPDYVFQHSAVRRSAMVYCARAIWGWSAAALKQQLTRRPPCPLPPAANRCHPLPPAANRCHPLPPAARRCHPPSAQHCPRAVMLLRYSANQAPDQECSLGRIFSYTTGPSLQPHIALGREIILITRIR